MSSGKNDTEKEPAITEIESPGSKDAMSIALMSSEVLLQAKPPEGPKHKAWRDKLKKALGKRLRAEGFTGKEKKKILRDMLKGLWGVLKNIWRLYKVLRAYKKAKKDAGPEPAWGQ